MTVIVTFDAADAASHHLVGGKGANLGRLTQGGFLVPPGFTITTETYRDFLGRSGLEAGIRTILVGTDHGDAAVLERDAAHIRDLIVQTPFPEGVAAEIRAAYARLGGDPFVAVRSSGSAEDLAEASFAGLHDTYLDIQGGDHLLDAVRRCWASLWTARAMSYRQTKGFDHLRVAIAIVVQKMVASEVSGVMFTGNPMNTATDELIINASWGLGEAIVSGITTPDEFIVKAGEHRIIEKRLGGKSMRVVRDPATGRGTVAEAVPDELRAAFSLTDAQAGKLAALGERIEQYYEGFPQDIEWALSDGKFYVLQARPITGVEFSWDDDVNASVKGPPIHDDQLWGRAMSDEGWAGACTPLMFSWRGVAMCEGHSRVVTIAGYPHLGNEGRKLWYFWKGKAYFNVDQDRAFIEELTLPAFRPHVMGRMPKDWREEVQKAPFDFMKYVNMYFRYYTVVPQEAFQWIQITNQYLATQKEAHDGFSPEKLRALTDEELKAYNKHLFELEFEFGNAIWPGMILFWRDAAGVFDLMLRNFYTGGNPGVAADLLGGSPRRGATAGENFELFAFAQRIRNSAVLRPLFDAAKEAPEFFGRLDESEDGSTFRRDYDDFVSRNGHRGHSDRDLYFLRRVENPSVDFHPLKALLSAETLIDPAEMEEKVNARREAARADVIENFTKQPFGAIKAEIFKLVHEYILECIIARDEERHFHDRATFACKLGYAEVGRRLVERGVLQTDRDFFFLTEGELYELLDGAPMTRLIRAKIAARMRDFDRVNDKEISSPLFLRRNMPSTLDKPVYGDGVFQGVPTSRGVVTGTARVVKSLSEIPRVRAGEILIVNATDPGWTPVFMLIKGIVLETGGMLAHGSLLAREYGFPAVQVEDAMQYIPDGATITVDGNAGIVTIHTDDPQGSEAEPVPAAAE